MGAKRKLLAISRWLGKIPSLGYALIYIALIPTFGIIYSLLPGSFYHATLQHEDTFEAKRLSIQSQLNNIVEKNWASYPSEHDRSIADNNKTWIIQPLYLDNVQIQDNRVDCTTELLFWPKFTKEGWTGKQYLSLKTSFNVYPEFDIVFTHIELPDNMKKFFPDEDAKSDFESTIFNIPENTAALLKLPTGVRQDILDYSRGVQGTGSSIEGNFWRMLYLSSCTITTLGYGDIVPMTTTSRLLVSIEAILGIVLIGLFLNALSFERSFVERLDNVSEQAKQ